MRLPFLKHLLVDCTGVNSRIWFYRTGCLVSALSVVNSTANVACFCMDWFSGAPVHSNTWHIMLHAVCTLMSVAVGIPPLLISVSALRGARQHPDVWSDAAELCGQSRIGGLHSDSGLTRFLLLSTVSSAGIIMFNTVSVGSLYVGVGDLFVSQWRVSQGRLDRIQAHYACCGVEGFADWLNTAGRLPPSCTASGSTSISSAYQQKKNGNNGASQQQQQQQKPQQKQLVPVHKNGCQSPMIGEHAIVCGISNMLVFAGVLLLVAAWTRVEGEAAISVTELRSKTFNHPKHIGDAGEFMDERQRALASRCAVRSTSRRVDTDAGSSRGSSTPVKKLPSLLRSDGFLYREDSQSKSSRDHSSSSSVSTGGSSEAGRSGRGGGFNENNSALEASPVGPWRSAQVVNSVDREIALGLAWESLMKPQRRLDSVWVACEVTPRQPLDAARLLEDASASPSSGRRTRRRRHPQRRDTPVGFVERRPLFLSDFLDDWRSHCQTEAFKTCESGKSPV